MAKKPRKSIAVLTSGGDAPGMNAAVRAVVRTALDRGIQAYAIREGYQGMVDGGKSICAMGWESVGGILQQGGTIIGSARSQDFRERAGRLEAAQNLLSHGIDSLVVIGGDGSLTGASLFRAEWPDLLRELQETGAIDAETAARHSVLTVTGLVGSIDNDMFGTDMTIGADTALHRIIEAIDCLTSTASSHQRSFVVEVMGRNCGYLALMSAIATASDWVLIPESPPEGDDWEASMCDALQAGRNAGRRDNVVVVAEGATDRKGTHISASYVKKVLETRLGHDVRETILGHVQRGGSPSAFDRYMSTVLGHAAVDHLLTGDPGSEPSLIGMRGNRITREPLMECVDRNHALAEAVRNQDFERAMDLRGASFQATFQTLKTLVRAVPRAPDVGHRRFRFAILNSGGPAPGMNASVRIAVRLGLDRGHVIYGVRNGFHGLIRDDFREMDWMSVAGWASRGGSELGTDRTVPDHRHFYSIARHLEKHKINGLVIIGGWPAYEAAYRMVQARDSYSAFNIPIICVPASIDNNLPGSEHSIGADTALNCVVDAVDKIKQSAVAAGRVFVVEVMGRNCGYLALMSGLATGAERVYLNEEGVSLNDLQQDVERLKEGFRVGKRLGLIIRNERANETYTTGFMRSLFEAEGHGLFEVREAILGHMQQGGDPTVFDRIMATRFASQAISHVIRQAEKSSAEGAFLGMQAGSMRSHNIEEFPRIADREKLRPKEEWWLSLRPIAKLMAQPRPRHHWR